MVVSMLVNNVNLPQSSFLYKYTHDSVIIAKIKLPSFNGTTDIRPLVFFLFIYPSTFPFQIFNIKMQNTFIHTFVMETY